MAPERKYCVTPQEAIEILREHVWSMSMCMTLEEYRRQDDSFRMAIDALERLGAEDD